MSHRIGERPWRSSGQPTPFITFCQVARSNNTITRRIESMGRIWENRFTKIIVLLPHTGLAIDESTDATSEAQLLV